MRGGVSCELQIERNKAAKAQLILALMNMLTDALLVLVNLVNGQFGLIGPTLLSLIELPKQQRRIVAAGQVRHREITRHGAVIARAKRIEQARSLSARNRCIPR